MKNTIGFWKLLGHICISQPFLLDLIPRLLKRKRLQKKILLGSGNYWAIFASLSYIIILSYNLPFVLKVRGSDSKKKKKN
jgi:hypothetical protein